MVLDSHGVPVWYLRLPLQTSAWNVESFDGGISFVPFSAASRGYEVHRLSPPRTTTIQPRGWPIDPHDMRPLANGHFLVLSDRVQTGVDLTGFHARGSDGGSESFGADSSILPCDILEVDTAGKVWWTWISTDHLDPVKDTTLQVLYRGPDGVPTPDPFHCNSIDVDTANGNILVSARQMDSIFYIDRASGNILWKMGGVDYTKDGAAYVPLSSADSFHRQHDARLQGGWSTTCGGQVSVFDDESGAGSASRAAVYDVSLGGAESCRGQPSARLSWQWAGNKASYAMGSFRITSDGSRVIGWGTDGIPGLVFTEVDEAGDRLLDLYFTDDSASFRAVKVPLDAMDLNAMRHTSGLAEP
jgi:Arylsulfotransferase (ASST)